MNDDPNEPILVTGASGFVGNCVVRRLLSNKRQVHVLLRRESNAWRMQDLLGQIQVHCADLVDQATVDRIVESIQPRIVLHLAAFGAYESQMDARRIFETNILGSLNMLNASRSHGVRLFINTGSSSEYGFKSGPINESDILAPNSTYAISKAAQTHLCDLTANKGETTVVTFRLFSVFGPWEEPTRLFPTVLRRAKMGLPLEMVDPDTARDFIYIDDVVDVLTDFVRLQRLRHTVYNVGTGIQSTLRDVVAVVRTVVAKEIEVRWSAMKPRVWDSTRWQADISRIKSELGWSPKYSLAQGVSRMAEWMDSAGKAYGHVR